MELYEIMRHYGYGLPEAPTSTTATGKIFTDKEKALAKANEMYLEETTEKERKSAWCPLRYTVRTITANN